MTSTRPSAATACGGSMRWNSRPASICAGASSASSASAAASSPRARRAIAVRRLRLGFRELLAGLADEGVGSGEHLFLAGAREDQVAALHRDPGHAVQAVRARHPRGAAKLALDAERMQSRVVLRHVDLLL